MKISTVGRKRKIEKKEDGKMKGKVENKKREGRIKCGKVKGAKTARKR